MNPARVMTQTSTGQAEVSRSRYDRACLLLIEDVHARLGEYLKDDRGYPPDVLLLDVLGMAAEPFGEDVDSWVADSELRHGDPFEKSDPDAAHDAARDAEMGVW